jgi:hypothetical protein
MISAHLPKRSIALQTGLPRAAYKTTDNDISTLLTNLAHFFGEVVTDKVIYLCQVKINALAQSKRMMSLKFSA